jgi:hypothetical protein
MPADVANLPETFRADELLTTVKTLLGDAGVAVAND